MLARLALILALAVMGAVAIGAASEAPAAPESETIRCKRGFRHALILALAVMGAVAIGAASEAPAAPESETIRCKRGFRHAIIAGRHRCLRVGQRCNRRHDRQYHRDGLHCHTGRLARRRPVPPQPPPAPQPPPTAEEIFDDEATDRPEWMGVGTGFFGTKRVLVPVAGAQIEADAVRVAYGKEQVKDSPDVDSDEISEALEAELYAYYGLDSSRRESESRLPEGAVDTGLTSAPDSPGDAQEGDAMLTRSEEELAVGKRQVGAGRARLRKRVETEPVEVDVELRRETARVVREPVSGTVPDAEIGDEEAEVALREEQPVVEKRAVAKERVGLTTEVETERRTVADEVRKERVDVEGDRVDR